MKIYQAATLTVCLLLSACAAAPVEKQIPALETVAPSPAASEIIKPFPADSFYDLLVAEFALRRNRYDLALGNYLQQAHQIQDPDIAKHTTRLSQFLHADTATLDAAQLWVELEPESLEAQYTLATMLAKHKRPVEAVVHMQNVLEQGGRTNFAMIAANALELPEATRKALEDKLVPLAEKYPQNPQLLIAQALLLQQRQQLEPALSLVRKAKKQDSTELQATVIEARLLKQLGRNQQAQDQLFAAVNSYPKNQRLRLELARALMDSDLNKAKEQFIILLDQSPQDPDLLLPVALICRELKQWQEAEDYFNRLLKTGKRSGEAHYYLGQLAETKGELSAAIEHYKQIPFNKNFVAVANRISSIYMQLGDAAAARRYLTTLRQQHPELSVRLYLTEAEILLTNQQIDEGSQLLSEALLIHPDQVSLLYARSMFSEKRNDLVSMEADLRTILKQDPDNVNALNTLGYVLTNRNDRLEEAYRLISRAIELKPNDPAIIDSLGWIEYRLGNLQEALKLLRKAYAVYPDHEVAAHLGEVLWQLDRKQEAQAIWKEATERTPDSTILNSTIERLQGSPLNSTAETE